MTSRRQRRTVQRILVLLLLLIAAVSVGRLVVGPGPGADPRPPLSEPADRLTSVPRPPADILESRKTTAAEPGTLSDRARATADAMPRARRPGSTGEDVRATTPLPIGREVELASDDSAGARARTAPPTPPATEPASADHDEGLFELRLANLPASRTVLVLVDRRGAPLLPLTALLEFLEIPHQVTSEQVLLEWPPPEWRARLDLRTRTLQVDGSSAVVAAADWVARPEELFVGVDAVRRLLGAEVHVDWENLRILIRGEDPFPLSARIANEANRARLLGRGVERSRGAADEVGYPSESGGFAAGWMIAVSGAGGETRTNARGTVGAALLGGSLRVGGGLTSSSREGPRATPMFGQYSRAFGPEAPIRQLRAGEIMTEGLVGRAIHGITISNDPLLTPDYFGEVLVEPVVPAGWEYEVYQGDQLLGVSARGESRPIPTHLGYGANPVRVRMIGPAGQERVQDLVYLIPASQVPGGDWRYRAGVGRCRDATCSVLSFGDVRRGITNRSTIGVGLEAASRPDAAGWALPYALVSHSPRPDLRIEARAQWHTLLHGSVQRYGARGGWRASAGWSGGGPGAAGSVPHWYGDGMAAFSIAGLRQPVLAHTRLRGRVAGEPDAWVTSVGTSLGAYHLRAGYENGFQREDVASVFASRRLRGLRTDLLRDLTISSEADLASSGMRNITVGVMARPFDRSNVAASVRWTAVSSTPQLSLSFVTRTPLAYLQAITNGGPSQASWFTSASGGVAYDPEMGAIATAMDALGRTGIAGRVFLDSDGDGAMGAGEEPLPGVPVLVGGARVVTDATGSYRHWGVVPHSVVRISVDTLSLDRPDLATTRAEARIRTVPNLFTRVDLALIRTHELIGRVEWADRQSLPAGITVEAVRQGDGEIYRAVTFSDGEYYFARLSPGRYRIRIAADALRALGAAADPASLEVSIDEGTGSDAIRTPPIILSRPETGWRELDR